MKYKSATYTTKDVKVFALEVFDYLNGRINKKVPARGINFVKDRDIEFGFNNKCSPQMLTATVYTNSLYVNPNAVIDMDRIHKEYYGQSITYEQFTGFIIQIIAHELSHLDQDIDQYKYCTDDDYANMIEITNELRTLKWVKSHYRKLIKVFDVKFDYKWAFDRSAYLDINEEKGYGYKDSDYIAVPDVHTKLFRDLDMILNLDTVGLLQEAIEKGYYDLQVETYKEKDFLKKGVTSETLNVDILYLGTISTLLTEPSRAYSVWEIIHKLMIGTFKRYIVGITGSIKERTITIIIIEKKNKLPRDDNHPMAVGTIRFDEDPETKWMKKYYNR
jgi:hypothetical protein